jgi:hypothetical protein
MNHADNLTELRAIASSNNNLVNSITVYSDLKSIEVLKSMLAKRMLDEAGIRIDNVSIDIKPLWRYTGAVELINRQRLVYLAEVSFSDGTTTTYLDRYN